MKEGAVFLSKILDLNSNTNLIEKDKKTTIIYLMHRDDKVCKWSSSDITEDVKLLEIFDLSLMPTGTVFNSKASEQNFSDWLKWRSIPYSRKNMKLILQTLNLETTDFMIKSCNGAGLNDLYWYKEENSDLTWKDVNFYDNEWYTEENKLLFLKQKKGTSKTNLNTPDCVSIGNQPKCWIRENGKNYLLKADKYPIAMEAFTEKLASSVYYSSLDYDIYIDKENDIIAAKSPNFMEFEENKGKDFVTAQWYLRQFNYTNAKEYFLLLVKEIKNMGRKHIVNFLDMIIRDYIFLNADRHWDNFGFIKDRNKFKFAPVYDNGDCFGRNTNITDACCFILKETSENPDYVIDLLKEEGLLDYEELPYFEKGSSFFQKVLHDVYSKIDPEKYNISEFEDKKDVIIKEIERRCDYYSRTMYNID